VKSNMSFAIAFKVESSEEEPRSCGIACAVAVRVLPEGDTDGNEGTVKESVGPSISALSEC